MTLQSPYSEIAVGSPFTGAPLRIPLWETVNMLEMEHDNMRRRLALWHRARGVRGAFPGTTSFGAVRAQVRR